MSSSSYSQSEYTWYLKLKINNLAKRVASFESGNVYITLQQKLRSVISEQHREAEAHKKEVADLHAQIKTNRERWYEVTDDIMEEHMGIAVCEIGDGQKVGNVLTSIWSAFDAAKEI